MYIYSGFDLLRRLGFTTSHPSYPSRLTSYKKTNTPSSPATHLQKEFIFPQSPKLVRQVKNKNVWLTVTSLRASTVFLQGTPDSPRSSGLSRGPTLENPTIPISNLHKSILMCIYVCLYGYIHSQETLTRFPSKYCFLRPRE